MAATRKEDNSQSLDERIAEHVMGWGYDPEIVIPEYGTDISQALKIVEKLGKMFPNATWYIETVPYETGMMYWVCYTQDTMDTNSEWIVYEAESLPEAICQVALMFAAKGK